MQTPGEMHAVSPPLCLHSYVTAPRHDTINRFKSFLQVSDESFIKNFNISNSICEAYTSSKHKINRFKISPPPPRNQVDNVRFIFFIISIISWHYDTIFCWRSPILAINFRFCYSVRGWVPEGGGDLKESKRESSVIICEVSLQYRCGKRGLRPGRQKGKQLAYLSGPLKVGKLRRRKVRTFNLWWYSNSNNFFKNYLIFFLFFFYNLNFFFCIKNT